MAETRLTKRVIDSMSYEGDAARNERDVRWDAEVSGFGVRVYPSGKKGFVLSYRADGRKRLISLGDFGVLTVDEARKMARERLVVVTRGGDPLADRQRAVSGKTVSDLCDAFVHRHVEAKTGKRPEGLKSARDVKRRIELVKTEWGSRRASSITRADIAGLHHRIGKTAPYEANRVVALLSKMFNVARVWGFVDEGHPSPTGGVEKFSERARERYVTAAEMPRLVAAVEKEKSIYIRGVVWLYLLTGLRREELLRARWEDLDEDRSELVVRDTKNGSTLVVPLSNKAMQILRSLPVVEGNPFIFPGRRRGQHLVNITKAWEAIRTEAGIGDVRIHDLRRTVGSWLAQNGATLHLVGKVLGHKSEAPTKIYARLATDNVKAALGAHERRLLKAARQKGREDAAAKSP
jgi:integrase